MPIYKRNACMYAIMEFKEERHNRPLKYKYAVMLTLAEYSVEGEVKKLLNKFTCISKSLNCLTELYYNE